MNILALSDIVIPFIYSPQIKQRFANADLVVGCGDLPYYYQEYVISLLDIPLVYVRGNHSKPLEYSTGMARRAPLGGIDLHGRAIREKGLLLAGVEGSLRYRPGPFQYSQGGMWKHVLLLAPRLMVNRMLHGRFLDVFVTHAPAVGIHDEKDLPHRGINAFRWFIKVFQPGYHLHGHIHIYHPDTVTETQFGKTKVINTFGYREIEIEPAFSSSLKEKETGKLNSHSAVLHGDREKS